MSDHIPQYGAQHPEHWRRDLNPDPLAGQNVGASAPNPEQPGRTRFAIDLKDIHQRYPELSNEELKRVPVLPKGARLEQGATYVDLNGSRRELTAMGDMEVGADNWYVPKDSVDYQLWNKLIGVRNPERLGLADER